MDTTQLVGRCIGCFHDFATGPCGGCGAVDYEPPVKLPAPPNQGDKADDDE